MVFCIKSLLSFNGIDSLILKLVVFNSLVFFYRRAEEKFQIITKLLIQAELSPAVSALFCGFPGTIAIIVYKNHLRESLNCTYVFLTEYLF